VKGVYANAFQLAFDVAKKAERAMQHELGDTSLTYIQSNYLDGTEGLMAGEKLMFDLRRMETEYTNLNQREYELTKHVSLLQVNPLALVQLRATGTCLVTLPEELFDLDGPGHYFRRVKSVAVTIPCVTGPYTSVNCTLSLQQSSIRTSADAATGYLRQGADDIRFNDYYGTLQSIVTSSGQSDSGLFEANLNDERYLPFERVGVISQWQLTLPSDVPQFDFDTITDVILHIRYTAREGGELLKTAAVVNLQKQIQKAQTVGSMRLFSVRHEFPTEWAKFRSPAGATGAAPATLALSFLPQHYPYWAQSFIGQNKLSITGVRLIAEMPANAGVNTVNFCDHLDMTSGHKVGLAVNSQWDGLLDGTWPKPALPPAITPAPPATPFTLNADNNGMKDLWLAVTWGHT